MANEYLVNSDDLTAVADAIRTKGGTSNALAFPDGFVEAVGAIQAGATKAGWVRPSDWPNYDLIDRTNMEAIFFTYSCKDIIREPTLIDCAAFHAQTTTGEYLVERGNIDASGFTSVASFAMKSDTTFSELLPTDEGDYVVYKISPVTEGAHLTRISMNNPQQINISYMLQKCVERWGRAPYIQYFGYGYIYRSWDNKYVKAESIIDCVQVTDVSGIWKNCSSLQSLDLSGWNVSNVTNMSNCWNGCSSLQSLDLSGWDVSNVTNMENCWKICGALSVLDLSGWNVSNVTNMSSICDGCGALSVLDLSGWNVSNVTDIYRAWINCYSLQSLDLSGWNVSNVTNMPYCWNGCSSLQKIIMPIMYKSFSIPNSSLISVDSLANIINALASVDTTQTLTLSSETKALLTDEQITAATEKGWTIA